MPDIAAGERKAIWTETDRIDAGLMFRVKGHDDHVAFAELLPRISRAIDGPLRRILPEAEFDDAWAEVALRVWHRREKYHEERGTVRAWVSAISRNHALDWKRRHAGRRHMDIDRVAHALADDGSDPAGAIEQADWASYVRGICNEVLSDFPPDIRESFELRLGGVHYATIAARSGRPIGTVATALARVRAKVLSRMSEVRLCLAFSEELND